MPKAEPVLYEYEVPSLEKAFAQDLRSSTDKKEKPSQSRSHAIRTKIFGGPQVPSKGTC